VAVAAGVGPPAAAGPAAALGAFLPNNTLAGAISQIRHSKYFK